MELEVCNILFEMFHGYADDTQQYLSMRAGGNRPASQASGLSQGQKVLEDFIFLSFFNSDKSEVILFGPKLIRNRLT